MQEHRVPVAGLAADLAGVRLAVFSDLHLGWFAGARDLALVLDRVQAARPDLALFLGDLVHAGPGPLPAAARELAALRPPLGAFAVLGNRDHRAGAAAVQAALGQAGLTVLRNCQVLVRRGRGALALAGAGSARAGDQDLDAALAGAPAGAPVLLLWHEPDLAARADARGVALQVSGHSHGGQICLPGGRPVCLPRLGRRYPAGLCRLPGGMRLFTTRGVGVTGPPLRLFCPPEVAVLVLEPA